MGLQREDSEEYEEMSSLVLTNKPLKVADSASNTVLQDQSASEGYAVFDPPSAEHSALRQVKKQVSMLEEKLNEIGRRVGTSVNIPELKSKLDEVSKRLTTLEQNVCHYLGWYDCSTELTYIFLQRFPNTGTMQLWPVLQMLMTPVRRTKHSFNALLALR